MDLNFSLGWPAGLVDFQGMGNSCKLSLLLGAGEAVGGPAAPGAAAGAPAAGVGEVGEVDPDVVVEVVGAPGVGFFWNMLRMLFLRLGT